MERGGGRCGGQCPFQTSPRYLVWNSERKFSDRSWRRELIFRHLDHFPSSWPVVRVSHLSSSLNGWTARNLPSRNWEGTGLLFLVIEFYYSRILFHIMCPIRSTEVIKPDLWMKSFSREQRSVFQHHVHSRNRCDMHSDLSEKCGTVTALAWVVSENAWREQAGRVVTDKHLPPI